MEFGVPWGLEDSDFEFEPQILRDGLTLFYPSDRSRIADRERPSGSGDRLGQEDGIRQVKDLHSGFPLYPLAPL